MNEREIERKKRYEERMQRAFNEMLVRNNIELVDDNGYVIKLKYKGVEFGLLSNTDWNSWNKHYQVWVVGGKTLATRCRLEVAIAKAKSYIESEER